MDQELRAKLDQELMSTIRRIRAAGLAVSGHSMEDAERRRTADLFELAQETELAEGRLGDGERLVRRLHLLRGAIERFERGTYGTCVECEETIPRARLRVVPEATTCVRCQEQRESRIRRVA